MMGAMDARNMYSNLAVNKYLQTVASRWISSTQNYDARKHEYIKNEVLFLYLFNVLIHSLPVPVAARSKAYVYGRSPFETVGWNPTGGMDVYLL